MAAETKMVYPDIKVTLVHSREHLLSSEPLPKDFADETLRILRENDVEVVLGKRVLDIGSGDRKRLKLSDGSSIDASHVISAISRPLSTSRYLPAKALDEEKQVKVTPALQFDHTVANSAVHFAVGDIAAYPPNPTPVIKRCGGAMYHGITAAANVYQHMLHRLGVISKPVYQEIATYAPAIALALGTTAIGYSPQAGIDAGPAVRERMFGNDLGFTICWNYLGLGEHEMAAKA
jgi:NADH dehydrogenase FAD-containing subunit